MEEFLKAYFEALDFCGVEYDREQASWHAKSFFVRTFPYLPKDKTFTNLGWDFAMTHTEQGCGFWDGDWPLDLEDFLTELALTYPPELTPMEVPK